MNKNPFGLELIFGNFGKAVEDWKENIHYYEQIQGVVIDIKFLAYNYMTISGTYKNELAMCIEQIFN